MQFMAFHFIFLKKHAFKTRVSLGLKKGQAADNKKRALLIFLRAYFLFSKALLNLRVSDTFNV